MQLDIGPNTLPIDPITHVRAQGIRRVLVLVLALALVLVQWCCPRRTTESTVPRERHGPQHGVSSTLED